MPWALVGGLAISARIEPRFTRDLDIAIAVENDARAEEVGVPGGPSDNTLLSISGGRPIRVSEQAKRHDRR